MSGPLWLALTIAVLCLVSLLVAARATLPFDRGMSQWLLGWDGGELHAVLPAVGALGSTPAISAATLCTIIALVVVQRPADAMRVLLIVGVSVVLTLAIKNMVARSRPDLLAARAFEDGFSFPSGHASMAIAMYGAIAVLAAQSPLKPALRAVIVGGLVALIIAIGISRTYLGVHYPTDIVGGWLTGVAAIIVVHVTMLRFESGRTSPPRVFQRFDKIDLKGMRHTGSTGIPGAVNGDAVRRR